MHGRIIANLDTGKVVHLVVRPPGVQANPQNGNCWGEMGSTMNEKILIVPIR